MAEVAARIIDLFRQHAEAWVAARGEGVQEQVWLGKFLAQMGDCPRVLDIGCGAGLPVAGYLRGKGCAVTGIDSSPELIEIARTRLPDVQWSVADMRSLELSTLFDGLIAWDSFFHLTPDDQRAMFAVFGRHAAQGAALMFTSGPRYGVTIGEFQGEPLYHASLDPDECRALLAAHGFEVTDHVAEDPACGGHSVWLARRCV